MIEIISWEDVRLSITLYLSYQGKFNFAEERCWIVYQVISMNGFHPEKEEVTILETEAERNVTSHNNVSK